MIGIDKKDMSECVVSEGDVQKYVGYLAMKVDELDRPGRILHGVDRLDFFLEIDGKVPKPILDNLVTGRPNAPMTYVTLSFTLQ
jgi:hypothetical protein